MFASASQATQPHTAASVAAGSLSCRHTMPLLFLKHWTIQILLIHCSHTTVVIIIAPSSDMSKVHLSSVWKWFASKSKSQSFRVHVSRTPAITFWSKMIECRWMHIVMLTESAPSMTCCTLYHKKTCIVCSARYPWLSPWTVCEVQCSLEPFVSTFTLLLHLLIRRFIGLHFYRPLLDISRLTLTLISPLGLFY